MKYCVRYDENNKNIFSKVDELLIKYDKEEDYIDILSQDIFINKKIIIALYIDDFNIIEIEKIANIKNYFKDRLEISLQIPYINDIKILNSLKEKDLKYFFVSFVNSWEQLYNYCTLGVSEMYIVEQLCFELDQVRSVLKEKNIKIRTFPNIAQSFVYETPVLCKFFIRPEDTDKFENYIDTLEFFGNPSEHINLFKIYTEDKEWNNDLQNLVIGMDTEVFNKDIIEDFAQYRISCGRICLKGKKCSYNCIKK